MTGFFEPTPENTLAYILTGEWSDEYELDKEQLKRMAEVLETLMKGRMIAGVEIPPMQTPPALPPKGFGNPSLN